MNRDEAIARLKGCETDVRGLGATALFLFGSTARNEATAASDIDLFVDYDPESFGLIELVRLRARLTAKLGVPADVTTREGLHPRLRPAIESEAVQVL
jgi:uncharacterized protein